MNPAGRRPGPVKKKERFTGLIDEEHLPVGGRPGRETEKRKPCYTFWMRVSVFPAVDARRDERWNFGDDLWPFLLLLPCRLMTAQKLMRRPWLFPGSVRVPVLAHIQHSGEVKVVPT